MFATKVKSTRSEVAPWEQFCKDEARRAAHEFLEKVRRLQTVDRSSMEIPESVFATKFSAHFMDEVMDLTGGAPNTINPVGDLSGKKKAGAGKSWWNIFKRRQARDDRGALASSATNKNQSNGVAPTSSTTVLEAYVKMLDMGNSSHALSWQACRLVLTSEQGNHQLEIYCPPKVRRRERKREGEEGAIGSREYTLFVFALTVHCTVVCASHTPIYFISSSYHHRAFHTGAMLSPHTHACHITNTHGYTCCVAAYVTSALLLISRGVCECRRVRKVYHMYNMFEVIVPLLFLSVICLPRYVYRHLYMCVCVQSPPTLPYPCSSTTLQSHNVLGLLYPHLCVEAFHILPQVSCIMHV